MTAELKLDENHVYRIGDRIIPGVTATINSHVNGWKAGQFYLDRGRAVHAAVALAVEGRLDASSLDPRIVGRVQSIMNFIHDIELEPVAVEKKLAHKFHGYAGTLDLVGTCKKFGLVLCDWKGSITPAAEIQIASYKMLWDQYQNGEIDMGCALQCRDSGQYKAQWFTKRALKTGAGVFLAMLTISSWKLKHGLINSPE